MPAAASPSRPSAGPTWWKSRARTFAASVSALYNAAQMKRVPLKFLWWPIAKVQEGIGGKARFYTAGVAVLLAILTAVMILVPYPLRMDAKGQLQPVENRKVFPLKDGILRQIYVKQGQHVQPGDTVAEL